ncbi:MAG: hypothetical protein K8M05_06150 [Deltaproteobacteria bacterium]|nr:hypothetical protein [Kofleriaceae bacterium]
MPTQSVSIAVLLAGTIGRLVPHYAGGQLLGTLMRHVLAAVALALHPIGVVATTEAASLMSTPGLTLLAPTARRRTDPRAVALPAVAPAADEEDLPALGAGADDEAQRVHGSGRDRQELDVRLAPCDEHLVDAALALT